MSLALSAIAAVTLTACGGGGTKVSTSDAQTTTTAAVAAATTTTVASGGATTTTSAGGATTTTKPATSSGKVNANNATIPELQKAFEAVGVSQAARWAAEVDEYRPYPNDPKWGKLRQELGKYNIAPDQLEKIISVLEI
jgi:hypothetical protein